MAKEQLEHVSSNIIWFCWFQRLDNAPLIVKKCYESLKKNLYNHKIVTRYLCYKYWKKNNFLIDYFLLHEFMSIVLEKM